MNVSRWREQDARKVVLDSDVVYYEFVHYVHVWRTTRRGFVDDADDHLKRILYLYKGCI